MPEAEGYRFEPLQRRGALLGLGWSQLAVVALCVLSAVSFVKAWPGLAGFAAGAAVLGLGVACCRSAAGRPPLEWARVASAFAARPRRSPGGAPAGKLSVETCPGGVLAALSRPARPDRVLVGLARGVRLVELPAGPVQGALGALLDERDGALSAVLTASGPMFCLADRPDQERRLAAWAGALESVGSHRTGLWRLQWCQRALPAGSGPQMASVQGSPGRGLATAGQLDLLEAAAQDAWRHEVLLVATVRCPGRRRQLMARAEDALRSQVGGLRSQLLAAGLSCDGALDAGGLAAALLAGLAAGPLAAAGTGDSRLTARPTVREHWSAVQVDGLWHRTYWVAEWPLSRVAPDFLSPLLNGRARRAFSLVLRPVPADRAARDAESSRTAQVADAQLRAQGGFLETARQRRRAEAVEGREAELADGRASFEFAGYVTVSAGSEATLEEAAADLQRCAGRARLRLQALYGQQREALTWAMPLGRGL